MRKKVESKVGLIDTKDYMENTKSRFLEKIRSRILCVILLLLLVFLVSVSMTASVHRWGDTSTYYMQIQSIANDFDVKYEQKDLQRTFTNKLDDVPNGLFLIKDDNKNYFYGKEYSYALFATPFFKIFGNNGILLFNALMFFLMIYMGYIVLRMNNRYDTALIFSMLYFFTSVAFVYVFWLHPEIYNMFLIMLGLFLWFRSIYSDKNKEMDLPEGNISKEKVAHSPSNLLFIAATAFGLATFAKIPNATLFLPLLGWELYNKRFKNLILCALFFLLPLAVLFGFFYLSSGTVLPYGGDRLYYGNQFPFMDGYVSDNEPGKHAFTTSSFSIESMVNIIDVTGIFYDTFYYIFERFTGFVWYYMPAIIALYLMFSQKNENYFSRSVGRFDFKKFGIIRLLILSALILNIMFYITNTHIANSPTNYFGGSHAVGNRYFYIFPAFLFLIDKIKIDWKLVTFFIIAILFIAPININSEENSFQPAKHTVNIPYSFLPFGYSLIDDLPFWGYSYEINNVTYYHLDDKIRLIVSRNSSFFYINENENGKLLVRSPKPLEDYRVNVFSLQDDNNINLKIGEERKNIVLNKFESGTLIFTPKPSYHTDKYTIYNMEIDATNSALFGTDKIQMSDIFIRENILIFYKGWYDSENHSGIQTRWMENNGVIKVYPTTEQVDVLIFDVTNFNKPRILQVYVNDELLSKTIISSGKEVTVKAKLIDGENTIRFYTPDGCQRPTDIRELKSGDYRCLSLVFQNVTITELR